MNNIGSVLLQTITTDTPQNAQKFEVVVAVIAVLFIGIVAYLVSIDRKLKKMENK